MKKMSYCVNCGVELDKSAKKCALCSTPVINPNEPATEEKSEAAPFSDTAYLPASLKRRFVAYIVTMIFLIPNIVCSFANAIFHSGGFWSFYVNATSLLIWVVLVFPFYTKKMRPYLMWAFDTIAVCSYVFFFFVMKHDSKSDWYYDSALPIIVIVSLMVVIYMLWSRKKKRHWMMKSIHIVCDIATAAFAVGSILDINRGIPHSFDVGMIIFVSCIVLIGFLIYCYSSKRMRFWLSKKFFV